MQCCSQPTLREGAAKLRKSGYVGIDTGTNEKLAADRQIDMSHQSPIKEPGALNNPNGAKRSMLPNEGVGSPNYWDDPQYCDAFDPPRKKLKQDEVKIKQKHTEV